MQFHLSELSIKSPYGTLNHLFWSANKAKKIAKGNTETQKGYPLNLTHKFRYGVFFNLVLKLLRGWNVEICC